MNQTIDPTKTYRTGKILKMDPIIEEKGYYWLLRQIKAGRLHAVNTSGPEEVARFVVSGEEIIKFIEKLKS